MQLDGRQTCASRRWINRETGKRLGGLLRFLNLIKAPIWSSADPAEVRGSSERCQLVAACHSVTRRGLRGGRLSNKARPPQPVTGPPLFKRTAASGVLSLAETPLQDLAPARRRR